MKNSLLTGVFALAALMLGACSSDVLPEPVETPCVDITPNYVDDIQGIIERSCAYSGCHLGGAPGTYNDYAGLLPDLESGRFENRVVSLRADPNVGMPPDYAPSDRPKDLTPGDLEMIICWLENGFPEQ
ncbi:hypothetical protein [Lewinella sp. 4G2]|uniref:hypothetical protein n=1 Tax=Lewinella sp. 4G2 TaxID=1803372 RepID=UPI0007B4EC86|nr:hypothetical protein [Lewinella sp. 4G2]OAV43890.1 hypothetical protein A3850_005005 [Lewinella sp. 4G2]